MPERHPGIGVALLLAGLLLAAVCWFDVGSAGAAAWLAQVPMALGIACLRGTRKRTRAGDAVCAACAGYAPLVWGVRCLAGGHGTQALGPPSRYAQCHQTANLCRSGGLGAATAARCTCSALACHI